MIIAFHTLGCKVNTYETESIWELFQKQDFTRVKHHEYADVYIINTCTVTNSGDSKSRKAIRKCIKQNPEAVIAVMGCYAQISPEEIAGIDGVDIIIGTTHREKIVDLVLEQLRQRSFVQDVVDVSRYRQFDQVHVTNFTENTRAFLKIQDGCNNFCTYCIIPFARGPVRSRDKDSIIEEAKHLIRNGYHEIVLTGIHTGGYGSDLKDYNLYQLLKELSQLPNLKRLRISSIEINELTDEILELIASNHVFAKHLHVPLQSGSNNILRQMHRKYSKEEYYKRIQYFRKMIPNLALTTDIIVGFPGETEADFEEMYQFVRTVGYSELHVFPYSKRSGTKAAAMKPQINGVIKSYRVNQLLQLNEISATNYIKQSMNQELSVIFEVSDEHFTYGHSDTYIYIKVDKDDSLINHIAPVEIIHPIYKNTYGKIKIG